MLIHVEFDGGCNPNPGGDPRWAFIVTRDGAVVGRGQGIAEAQYPRTNNTAEFTALLYGVQCAIWYANLAKAKTIRVQGDSRLAIDAVVKNWSMRKSSHLQHLAERIRFAIKRSRVPVRLFWVPRAQNMTCDAMTKD